MNITDNQYSSLKSFAFKKGAEYKLMRFDVEDALHSAIVQILDEGIPEEDWLSKIHNQLTILTKRNNRDNSRRSGYPVDRLC